MRHQSRHPRPETPSGAIRAAIRLPVRAVKGRAARLKVLGEREGKRRRGRRDRRRLVAAGRWRRSRRRRRCLVLGEGDRRVEAAERLQLLQRLHARVEFALDLPRRIAVDLAHRAAHARLAVDAVLRALHVGQRTHPARAKHASLHVAESAPIRAVELRTGLLEVLGERDLLWCRLTLYGGRRVQHSDPLSTSRRVAEHLGRRNAVGCKRRGQGGGRENGRS